MKNNSTHQEPTYPSYLPWINWCIATFFCLFQFLLQSSAGLMERQWERDFHLSSVGISELSSAFFYSYVLMQLPVGFLNDRYGPKRIMSLGALLIAIGCIALYYTHSFWYAFIARALMGAGSSFGFISMLYLCSIWFAAKRFSTMVGLAESFGMVLVSVCTVLTAWLIAVSGWRKATLWYGLIALAVMVLTQLFVRDKTQTLEAQIDKPKFWTSLKIVLKTKQVWLCGFYGFFAFSIVNAIASLWGVPFLRATYPISLSMAAAIVTMILYGIAAGAPLVGWLNLIFVRYKPIMLIGSLLTCASLSCAVFIPHLPIPLLFVLFFFTGLFGSSYIQCFAMAKEATPPNVHGVSMAATNMLIMIAAPILQILMGYLLASHFFSLSTHTNLTYRLTMGIVPLGIGLSFFIALAIKDRGEFT